MKLSGPLFSLTASGNLFPGHHFVTGRSGTYLRPTNVSTAYKSGLLMAIPRTVQFCSLAWPTLDQSYRDSWHEKATSSGLPPLNCLISDALDRLFLNLAPRVSASLSLPAPSNGINVAAAIGRWHAVELAWSWKPDAVNFWSAALFRDTSPPGIGNFQRLVAYVPYPATVWTDFAVTIGTTYYYLLVGSGIDGTLGSLSRAVSAAPLG